MSALSSSLSGAVGGTAVTVGFASTVGTEVAVVNELEPQPRPAQETKIAMASFMSQTIPSNEHRDVRRFVNLVLAGPVHALVALPMASDDSIYHLVEDGWISGEVYAPQSLQTEGFIHLSTRQQLLGTLERFFGHTQTMLIVEVSSALLESELRYEPSDGALFPHLYGPLNPEAVLTLHTVTRGADGNYKLPASL